jgi:hypothetical protein
MERVPSETSPVEQTEEQEALEDLTVSEEASAGVLGGFNPQPDPPGRA